MKTATYSPEDNKLRLYSAVRLSRDEYQQVRSAGFIWAPKQELFVAPMWTPEREDLLIAMCGEIGDEDTSLVDRAEQRAERFEDYSENRASDAARARKAVSAIADNIPLGQPILVGHHSERRARKDAERIENGMRKAVKMWDQSQYWADRAKGALRHAKYKERPDVRARRIKKIEADKRRQERTKAGHEEALRFWQGKFNLVNKEGEKRPLEISENNRTTIQRVLGSSEFGHMGCAIREGGSGDWDRWSVWDVLRPDEERYKACPSWTVQQCQDRAFELYPALIAHCDRWIAHYDNRIAYEKAMLDEGGGTAADQVKPEAGGACKCWASPRGGWSIIQKVNKVSVSVLDNWGNGGNDFKRIIEFDQLSSLMSKAQVDDLRKAGRLCAETPRGFLLCDEKQPERKPPTAPTPEAKEFEALRETVKAGVKVVSTPQLFPTPPDIAAKMAEIAFRDGWSVQVCAEMNDGCRVLEPSAGTGNLLRAIADVCEFESDLSNVVAVEVNRDLFENLKAGFPKSDIRHADFLSLNGELGKFDRIVMNPPFENGADIRHIEHAKRLLAPGGRLVAICANGPRQQASLQPLASQWIELPGGTFTGTGVHAAIIVIDN